MHISYHQYPSFLSPICLYEKYFSFLFLSHFHFWYTYIIYLQKFCKTDIKSIYYSFENAIEFETKTKTSGQKYITLWHQNQRERLFLESSEVTKLWYHRESIPMIKRLNFATNISNSLCTYHLWTEQSLENTLFESCQNIGVKLQGL